MSRLIGRHRGATSADSPVTLITHRLSIRNYRDVRKLFLRVGPAPVLVAAQRTIVPSLAHHE